METLTSDHQSELFTVESVQGYGALGRKERLFVQALFEGRTQREAARLAGHMGSDEVLDACASRVVRNVKVQALMNQAWARSGASIDDTLRQAAELQRLTFAEAACAASAPRRADAFAQWAKVSTLLASIHGKLQLKISGDVQHTVNGEVAFTLPSSALPVLAQMRRDVLTQANAEESVEVAGWPA